MKVIDKLNQTLVVFSIVFCSFDNYAQKDSIDAKNIAKANEIHEKIVPLLTGHITEENISILGSFLHDNRPKNGHIFFFSIFNPHLNEMISSNSLVDNRYISQAFRILQDKKEVTIVLQSVNDFHEALNPTYKKSAYSLNYIIYFRNDNSFGKNMDNFIDFRIDVIDSEIVNIGHQINKI